MSEIDSSQEFRVITVHGVNSKGEWQEEVAKALALFFNFEPIKYNHYRRFCGSELVLCPFVWLPLCTILIVAILMGWVHSGRGISLCILSILLLAALGAYPYRRWAVKKFREELSQKFKKGGPFLSLIAHSFGTYLSGRAMRDLSWASYDRMVLAGCVLADDFSWEGNAGVLMHVVSVLTARSPKHLLHALFQISTMRVLACDSLRPLTRTLPDEKIAFVAGLYRCVCSTHYAAPE